MVSKNLAVLPPTRDSLIGSLPLQVENKFKAPLVVPGPKKTETTNFLPFGEDGFTFLDVLDIVNPLQHLPVIGSFYREITGDTLDPLPRVVGNTLYLGPMGGAISGANLILKHTSGRNLDEHILALFDSDNHRAEDKAVSQDTASPNGDEKITATSNYLSDNNHVTSWAQSEILYRQHLLYTSNIVAKKASPSVKRGQNLSQKVDHAPPPIKNPSMLSAYKNQQIIVEKKTPLASAKKDLTENSERLPASVAAAAYNTAMKRVTNVLP